MEVIKQYAWLLDEFLDDYGNRLSCDGCNDYKWPEYLTRGMRLKILLAVQPDSEDFIGDADSEYTSNSLVLTGLRNLLRDGTAQ